MSLALRCLRPQTSGLCKSSTVAWPASLWTPSPFTLVRSRGQRVSRVCACSARAQTISDTACTGSWEHTHLRRSASCHPTPLADAYRVSEGGWLRLALKNVAGDGQITSVELVSCARVVGVACMGAAGWLHAGCALHTSPTLAHHARCTMQAPAATTNLNSSESFPSPLMARAPRARGDGAWRKADNTYGAVWELNNVPSPPLHMK